jgi:hypothetical protein
LTACHFDVRMRVAPFGLTSHKGIMLKVYNIIINFTQKRYDTQAFKYLTYN